MKNLAKGIGAVGLACVLLMFATLATTAGAVGGVLIAILFTAVVVAALIKHERENPNQKQ